jgi:hypothetical protein
LKVTHYLEQGGHIYYYHSAPTDNASSPHWKEWGTGLDGPAKIFTCLYGLEYRYVYEFQYEYHWLTESGGGTFGMAAHTTCGVENE